MAQEAIFHMALPVSSGSYFKVRSASPQHLLLVFFFFFLKETTVAREFFFWLGREGSTSWDWVVIKTRSFNLLFHERDNLGEACKDFYYNLNM